MCVHVRFCRNVATPNEYVFIDDARNWDDANAICRANGGELPSVSSPRQNDALKAFVVGNGGSITVWLGASEETTVSARLA